jgi:DNA-damage-inducible protein J
MNLQGNDRIDNKKYVRCNYLAHKFNHDIISYDRKGGSVMGTTNITIRMDEELKKQAEELFADLGLNMTTAIIAFTKQAVREQRIPFTISRNMPNEETKVAIDEVQKLKQDHSKKAYNSFSELLEEVKTDV